jgi:ketopantoate reductase
LRVLDAAGIPVEPPEGEPSPIRIRKMTEALRRPPKPEPVAGDDQKTYPSMWQDLYLERKSTEADFLNGEVIELGQKLGIPTPYNSGLVEIIDRMMEERLKPGIYTPAELHSVLRAQAEGLASGG